MQATSRVNSMPSLCHRSQDSPTCRLQATVPRTLSPAYWVCCLCINAIVCILLCNGVRSAAAQSHHKSKPVSQAAAQSQPFIGESAMRLAVLEQPPPDPDFPSTVFRLFLTPLSEPSTPTAAMPPATPFSFAYSIFPTARDQEYFPVFTASGILYGPELDTTDSTDTDLFAVTLSVLPLLAWVNYRVNDALQFRVSRFGAPAYFTPSASISPLPLAITLTQPLSQPLTVAQVRGTVILGTRNRGVQYALYAGVFAEETPRDLVAGASIGYTVGTTGFTLGIGYLYGPHAVGLDVFGGPYTDGARSWAGSDARALLHSLTDKDRLLIENQLLYGVITSESTPLAVRTRSTFYINYQWTVYHRFDRIYFGQGLPKLTEHILGVRFLPVAYVSLQAEVMVGGIDNDIGNAAGVRFSGTINF